MTLDDYGRQAPGVVRALRALGSAVDESGLDKALSELLKIRVSQINGCAFCLQYHLNLARGLGVDPARLDLLAVWRDTSLFSARERAALAWAEALTRMGEQHVPGELHAALSRHFDETEVAHLTAAIGAINAWNRIAGGLAFAPPPYTG